MTDEKSDHSGTETATKSAPGKRRIPVIIDVSPADVKSSSADTAVPAPAAAADEPMAETISAKSAQSRPSEASEPADAPARPTRGLGIVPAVGIGAVGGALAATFLQFAILPNFPSSDGLAAKVRQLETSAGQGPTADSVAALEKRLALIEGAAMGLKRDSDAALARAGAAAAATDALKSALTKLPAGGAGDANAAALAVTLAPIEARLAKLEETSAVPKVETRIAAERSEPVPGASSAAALTVAAQALILAMERSAPFPNELAAIEALDGGNPAIPVLKPLAAAGVPSMRALSQKFSALIPAILSSVSPAQPQGTFDRLAASASRLVRIRPVGDTGGDDPLAVVARIEAALGRGAAPDALSALTKLPEPARNLSQGFAADLKARADASAAAQAVLADALSKLSKPKS